MSKFIKILIMLCAAAVIFTSCDLRTVENKPEEHSSDATEQESYVESESVQTSKNTEESETVQTTGNTEEPEIYYNPATYFDSRVILIDAGHGFGDPGCTSKYMNGHYESEITYDMAVLLKGALEDMGYEAVLLRETESFPSESDIIRDAERFNMSIKTEKINVDNIFHAYERTIYANILHRDTPFALMLSLHVNALENYEDINGTELYYCSENDCTEQSSVLAGILKDKISAAYPDIRIKTEGTSWDGSYIVTKFTEMPSVLVEMGYATNEEDAKNLFDGTWRKEYIQALASSVDEYINSRNG